VEIQPFEKTEAANLAELQALTFREAYDDVHAAKDIEVYCSTHYTISNAVEDLTADDTSCWKGLVATEMLGYYIAKHRATPFLPDEKSSELKQIYVVRAAFGTGLGTALYEHALASMRSAGSDWVWLCVSDINARANAFYKKLGFVRIGTGPVLIVGNDELNSSILAQEL